MLKDRDVFNFFLDLFQNSNFLCIYIAYKPISKYGFRNSKCDRLLVKRQYDYRNDARHFSKLMDFDAAHISFN